jgi:ribosome biogenesis GTPase
MQDPDVQPVVGDWVAHRPIDPGFTDIEAVLPRRSMLSRKTSGIQSRKQVLASNVDAVLVVMGLDGDFNLRRLERLLIMVHESGAVPVIVLNKLDLASDPQADLRRVEDVAAGLPVMQLSARTGLGFEVLQSCLRPRETFVLIGSSGAGKSTLLNRLFGRDLMRTAPVRDGDSRGRHTTSHRQLFRLPSGALLIDSPGLREVQIWASDDSLDSAFDDIDALSRQCRFRDCAHGPEPGCAVLASVRAGKLSSERLASYLRLGRELRYLEVRQDQAVRLAEKRRWKIIHKAMRRDTKQRH